VGGIADLTRPAEPFAKIHLGARFPASLNRWMMSNRYGETAPSLIPATLEHFDIRLKMIAEGGPWHSVFPADQALEIIGLVRDGKLTDSGANYHTVRWVAEDDDATAALLSDLLKQSVVANTFCATLWPYEQVPVTGATSLIKRLTTKDDDDWAKLWLDLMKRARIVKFLKPKTHIRVLYNPNELGSQEEEALRERRRGHAINPSTLYGNLLALKEMISGARQSIRWYEQHMPAKVLEVMYREVDGQKVSDIRLLSGPVAIDVGTNDEFKRFRAEMAHERHVNAQWRVLTKEQARIHHGRFFITDGYARNLPPLNAILEGSVDEILPSEITRVQFDEWWDFGVDLDRYSPAAK
jgi:hypothetical protein